MIIPLQITFRDMDPSPALEADIRRRAEQLDKFFTRGITSCRVTVEAPHRHQRKGTPYRVRIDMTVPGTEIIVGRDPPGKIEWADPYVAVRDAFRAARRELLDYSRKLQGQVKAHDHPTTGIVRRLVREEGYSYGFLVTEDGRDVYFHENAVLDGFDNLHIGDRVRFTEEEGQRGPQASTVALTGRGNIPRIEKALRGNNVTP